MTTETGRDAVIAKFFERLNALPSPVLLFEELGRLALVDIALGKGNPEKLSARITKTVLHLIKGTFAEGNDKEVLKGVFGIDVEKCGRELAHEQLDVLRDRILLQLSAGEAGGAEVRTMFLKMATYSGMQGMTALAVAFAEEMNEDEEKIEMLQGVLVKQAEIMDAFNETLKVISQFADDLGEEEDEKGNPA